MCFLFPIVSPALPKGDCTVPKPKLDYSHCDFSSALDRKGMNAKNKLFVGANFQGANLQGADFEGFNLEGAVFVGANLQDAIFVEAKL
jgi:uncharacterized protein YjbI with pentapeptide repeats